MAAFEGQNKNWTIDPAFELPILMGPGPEGWEPKTVVQNFQETLAKYPNKEAMMFQPAKGADFVPITFKRYYDDVCTAAKAFVHFGLQPFQAVCILGFNSPEWMIADVACIFAGGLAAGIYTTNQPEACHYIAEDSNAAIAVVEDESQLKKFIKIKPKLPQLKAIVMWKGALPADVPEGVYTWEKMMEIGRTASPEVSRELEVRMAGLKASQCSTLIYTSGTTSNPKGVMISHDNLTWTARLMAEKVFSIGSEDHVVSYLPLSHIAAQMVDIHLPLTIGGTVWFAQPDALKGSLGETLKAARPTVFLGVPRVWEKIQEGLRRAGQDTTGIKKWLVDWAKEKGFGAFQADLKGEEQPWFFSVAKGLVLDPVRAALGLDRCRIQVTAAAPIARETLEYFGKLYIPVYELYGMSECTGPQTTCMPGKHKIGSCGPAIPATYLKIDQPDADGNGEICFKGRHIMMGYMKNAASTAEAIDSDRYLHSGDIGRIDEDGFLWITGRKKELIITAGGENIPPVLIENAVKEELPFISNVMLIGDKRKFLTLLVTLKTVLTAEGNPTHQLVSSFADICDSKTTDEAVTDAKLLKLITEGIARANTKATSKAQYIQKFAILPDDFSVDSGELTATLKLKRKVAEQKYLAVIEKLYEGGSD